MKRFLAFFVLFFGTTLAFGQFDAVQSVKQGMAMHGVQSSYTWQAGPVVPGGRWMVHQGNSFYYGGTRVIGVSPNGYPFYIQGVNQVPVVIGPIPVIPYSGYYQGFSPGSMSYPKSYNGPRKYRNSYNYRY